MTLAPGRFDYAPITERPVIRWPDNARVAFWVAPNMEGSGANYAGWSAMLVL